MVDRIHDDHEEKLFTLYEDRARVESMSRVDAAISPQAYNSFRQLQAIHLRRIFITSSGTFGLCPKDTQIGDAVVFLYGCPVPMILRRVDKFGSGNFWIVVGEAYIQDQMNGEVLKPEISAVRKKAGVDPGLFWIL